ncbi:MAG: transporter [Desulfobaccales bacterium]
MRSSPVIALLFLCLVFGGAEGDAADWAIVPSVTDRTEFTSNLNYSFIAPVSDCIFTLAPAAEFNYTTDISQLQGRLGLTGIHYLNNSQLDHIDQNYQINGRYQVAPRWNLTLKSAYIDDTSLEQEFLASGAIMTRTPRQSIQAGPGVTYNLTELLAATVNYNFNQVHYQDPRFQNYLTQGVGLNLTQQLKNEKTVLIGNIQAQETSYPAEDALFRSVGFQLGGKHQFSPECDVTLLGGINLWFMDTQTQALNLSQYPFFISVRQVKLQSSEADPFVDLSATRRWTNLSVSGEYSRNQYPSGNGGVVDLNRIYGSLRYELTERLSVGLSGYYSISDQISNQYSYQNDYFGISPIVTYKLTEELTISPGYQFGLREETAGGSSYSAKVQSVWLMLTYTRLSVASEPKPTPVGTQPATIPGWEKPGVLGGPPFQLH